MPESIYQGPHPRLQLIRILKRAGIDDEVIRANLGTGISATTYWRDIQEIEGHTDRASGPLPLPRKRTHHIVS